MFIGIDGTTMLRTKHYRNQMKGSFVHQLSERMKSLGYMSEYIPGPSIFSVGPTDDRTGWTKSQVWDLAQKAVRSIMRWRLAGDVGPITLAGYSRGAASCIQAAKILQKESPSLSISWLAPFDAVDRDLHADVDVISRNVQFAYHAIRDPAIGSRWYFGNCGMSIETPRPIAMRKFRATHAALGGLPWSGDHPCLPEVDVGPDFGVGQRFVCVPTITEAEDRAGSNDVKNWMWGHLRKHVRGL